CRGAAGADVLFVGADRPRRRCRLPVSRGQPGRFAGHGRDSRARRRMGLRPARGHVGAGLRLGSASAPAQGRALGGALMELVLQFVGVLGILIPFALMQFRRTTAHSWPYLSLNLAGSALLTWLALIESQ